jgi:flavin reductase (DIM6/NTAB) family NADH-FMN oxidoreductase RutF
MPVTQAEFRAALSRFPSGITVVTSRGTDGNFHGITVSAFCSVSLDPPLILVCIEKTTISHLAISSSGSFVVNVLARADEDLSERFSIPAANKFDGISYRVGLDGIPILDVALVALECRLQDAFDGGDHTIFVGLVAKASIRDGKPLVYFHGNYHDLLDP